MAPEGQTTSLAHALRLGEGRLIKTTSKVERNERKSETGVAMTDTDRFILNLVTRSLQPLGFEAPSSLVPKHER